MSSAPHRPQFVDLDGTLIAGDLGQISVVQAIAGAPWLLLLLPFWLLRGFAYTKARLADRVTPDAANLPYLEPVLDELRALRAAGVPLILATASHRRWAEPVAEKLALFDDLLATDGTVNLKGENKLAAIREYCRARGWTEFAYWGDSRADLKIWSAPDCVEAVTVNAKSTTIARLVGHSAARHIRTPRRTKAKALRKLLRPHQWLKNLLLFVPMLLAHKWDESTAWIAGCWAFAAFSMAASGVYVLNDLFDSAADRRHPTKKRRPFAVGDLPLSWGPPLIVLLWSGALACCLFGTYPQTQAITRPLFTIGLIGYVVLNLAYTLELKRRMVIDVLVLAGMYVTRIMLGGVATEVEVSKWLLAMSMFFFTSLAFAKRFTEVRKAVDPDRKSPGRGYSRNDAEMIALCGVAAGYMAVLVLALYISSPEMLLLYQNKFTLWLVCPLMMYWITRLWFVARRGELDDDPILYAIRDRMSWLTIITMIACVLAATYFDRLRDILSRWYA